MPRLPGRWAGLPVAPTVNTVVPDVALHPLQRVAVNKAAGDEEKQKKGGERLHPFFLVEDILYKDQIRAATDVKISM